MNKSVVRAFVTENKAVKSVELLAESLDASGFWPALAARAASLNLSPGQLQILIKPDLNAFEKGSPVATAPILVEQVIDWLHDRGYDHVNLGASADSSYFWAENRDVAVLADLLGYNYTTPGGRDYDVLDLSEDLVAIEFEPGNALHGTQIARAWHDAHFRICFARNKTDEREAFGLCLNSLLDVLPLVDKDYNYRQRLPSSNVIVDLLRKTPINFALIDATVSAHGNGGSRVPRAIDTACIIASPSPVLADFAGAMKMGLDPYVSPLAAGVFREYGLPAQYELDGDLAIYSDWRNVQPVLQDSYRRRDESITLNRLLTPWVQTLNPELFPLKNVVDAKLNPQLHPFFDKPDDNPSGLSLLILANYLVGICGQWLDAYRIMNNKDSVRQVEVPLGMDVEAFDTTDYQSIRSELDQLEVLLADIPEAAEGLRWREVDGATVFEFRRDLPIPFKLFTKRVDVARTIQFMNDYIGGVVVPIQRDAKDRVVRQLERNLYLPQPNYLVLYQGKSIDVSKIEVCDYTDARHRMYWKTMQSQNGSATHDDGVVTFTRSDKGTLVRVVGRQLFTLPPFWQLFDLNLVPDLKAVLVTQAYKTFFERTCANFEALVEEREIRLGRTWHASDDPYATESFPAQHIEQLGMRLVKHFENLMASKDSEWPAQGPEAVTPNHVDEDGFHHFEGVRGSATGGHDSPSTIVLREWEAWFKNFIEGLNSAVAQDLKQMTVRLQDEAR